MENATSRQAFALSPALQLIGFLAALFAAGCATNVPQRDAGGNPRIERISPEELAKLAPRVEPRLTTGDLVRLSREGLAPKEIIERLRASGTILALSASLVIDLAGQGVHREVLDWIVQSAELRRQAELAEAIAQRDALQEQLRKRPLYSGPWFPQIYSPGWYGQWGWYFHVPHPAGRAYWRHR